MASWVKCAGVDLPGHESSLGLCAFNLAGLFWLSGLVSEGGPHLQAPPSSLREGRWGAPHLPHWLASYVIAHVKHQHSSNAGHPDEGPMAHAPISDGYGGPLVLAC